MPAHGYMLYYTRKRVCPVPIDISLDGQPLFACVVVNVYHEKNDLA